MCGKRAVVFHQGALGDFLIAASAVDELAETRGFTRVDFWSKPEFVSLLAEKSYLGECLSCDSALASALLHDTLWRKAHLPDFLSLADHIFIFGQSGSRVMAERLQELLSAPVSWIKSFPREEEARRHVSDFIRSQFARIALPIAGKPLCLSPPLSEKSAAEGLLAALGIDSKPIFVHPGSGGLRKVWPLENWWGLLGWLRREFCARTLLSIGPADERLCEFESAARKTGIPVIRGLTPARLCALLSVCGLYMGSDSGVSHLAAAVGIPTIAVFGPSDPLVWGPRGNRAMVLRRQWKEEEVFRWGFSEYSDFGDEEVVEIVKGFLTADERR